MHKWLYSRTVINKQNIAVLGSLKLLTLLISRENLRRFPFMHCQVIHNFLFMLIRMQKEIAHGGPASAKPWKRNSQVITNNYTATP